MRNQYELQQEEPISDIIRVGRDLSEQLEKMRQARINLENFRNVRFFDNWDIDLDLAYVVKKEKEFEERKLLHTPEQKQISADA